eukprot:7326924-Prymnesium_polylepis.1
MPRRMVRARSGGGRARIIRWVAISFSEPLACRAGIIVARSFRVAEAFEGVGIFDSPTADPRVAVRGVT